MQFGSPPIERTLPPPPASMQPVAVPAISKGMDVRKSLHEHRAALGTANRRLKDSGKWYGVVRDTYKKGK